MIIVVSVLSNPEELGYNDFIDVFSTEGARLYSGRCSASPNPFRPSDKAPWWSVYGVIADGNYKAQLVDHPRFGKCVLLNDGGHVTARYPNPAQGGKFYLTEMFIHEGAIGGRNPLWRGSAGCLTLHRDVYKEFVDSLNGSVGTLIVKTIPGAVGGRNKIHI